jgi:hypothetical protein
VIGSIVGDAMNTAYQVIGANKSAPFSLKIHRGDGMALLAMNWVGGKPPGNFVGFAIEFKEPGGSQFWPVKNRIGFPGQRKKASDPSITSLEAPFQKFRWVHFPRDADKSGKFTYRVTPIFMDKAGVTSRGEAQTAALALMRETIPGKINVAFTRGYVSSQSFVANFAPDRNLSTLLPDKANEGLSFVPTHKKADDALAWMGFEARAVICEALDEAIKSKAEVRVIAYDLNLPEILSRLVKLKSRLKVIIDDSPPTHRKPDSPESEAAEILKKSAGKANVVRQHMAGLQHHKSIAISGKGVNKVIYGSTNFTWRGFYVQSNNAVIVTSKKAVDDYFRVFDTYFTAEKADAFRKSAASGRWHKLGVPGIDAQVGFSPHTVEKGLLEPLGKDLAKAKTSIFFSLAFLGQMKNGPIGPALGKKIKDKNVHTLGIADASVKAGNLGVTVLTPDNKRRVVRASALTGGVPAPFSTEPSGLSGNAGHHRGTRMHHKFVVIDFDTNDARVYLGSYNFSEPADRENGENLVMIKDRTVATSYMIEAVRLYDHYRFRSVQEDTKKLGKNKKVIELQPAPKKPGEKPWWDRHWTDSIRKRERELFA